MALITPYTRHLPAIAHIQSMEVETLDGPSRRYFVCLNLVGNSLWVEGTPVWHNRMSLPDCFVRNVTSGGIFEAGLSISHWHKPYKILIFLPQISEAVVLESQRGPWNFIGFAQKDLVDIDFVRNDAARLSKAEDFVDFDGLIPKRPDKGMIV